MLNALSFCSLLTYVSHRKSENYFPNVLGSTYLEILRDDLTNIYNYLLCSFQRTKLLYGVI